jgi:hypothetical protein
MNLYPVFFTIQSGELIFSNILEFVLKAKKTIEINDQSIVEFALFDHSIGMGTLYKDVFSIPGGVKILIENDTFRKDIVYDLSKWIHKKPKSRKDSLHEINQVLTSVISNYTSNVKNFNISLTGGFDGRLNFSFIKPHDYARLQTFSYGKSSSLQLTIPQKISNSLGFHYKPVFLDDEFTNQYAELGDEVIKLSGGITPFMRANYLFAYGKIKDFSRNCIIGQCDMIRPLYTNPAGSVFNNYSHDFFYKSGFQKFLKDYNYIGKNGFLNQNLFSIDIADRIYKNISSQYISGYKEFSNDEQYFLFLYKESLMKFWQTECHIVDLLVDDFISFADLDYIETLSTSAYFGLYKGIFARNQIKRRKAHDLYIDLMTLNNNSLNNFITDRFFKPKWLKYGYLGYLIATLGKQRANSRKKQLGNDTFGGETWSAKFYNRFRSELMCENKYFNLLNMGSNRPYSDDNNYRLNRHFSLKLWLDQLGLP